MNEDMYIKAKNDFISESKPSITKIALKYELNRKELSARLKEDGIYKGRGYSQEQVNKALKLMEEGKNLIEVCKILKVSRSCFTRYLDKNNLRKIKRKNYNCKIPLDSDIAKEIIKDYKSGIKRKELMNKYNISDKIIYKILDYYNIDFDGDVLARMWLRRFGAGRI